jgi:hypothetical protein
MQPKGVTSLHKCRVGKEENMQIKFNTIQEAESEREELSKKYDNVVLSYSLDVVTGKEHNVVLSYDEEEFRRSEIELHNLIVMSKTNEEGYKKLIDYYMQSLKWSEQKAIKYCIGLFNNGTINEIKMVGGANE